jgi:phosphoglycerol geranylgeranyltransferase
MTIFDSLSRFKSVALLIDPDKTIIDDCWILAINQSLPDIILVGGSQDFSFKKLDIVINTLKANTTIPILIFPGSIEQIHKQADGVLALSVIQSSSTRFIFDAIYDLAQLDVPSRFKSYFTPYLILSNTGETAVEKVLGSNLRKIENRDEFKKYLFLLKMIQPTTVYLEAGSGAKSTISRDYIIDLKSQIPHTFLFVGGGINSTDTASDLWSIGANCLVIGNKVEENLDFLSEICHARNLVNENLDYEFC